MSFMSIFLKWNTIDYALKPTLNNKMNNIKEVPVHCVNKECEYYMMDWAIRPGLDMIESLHRHLPEVKAKYLSPSPQLKPLVGMLKTLLSRFAENVEDPWKIADESATPHSFIKETSKGLANVLSAMNKFKVIGADISRLGSQPKLNLTLEGNQIVLFKPDIEHNRPPDAGVVAGLDRYYGEIASFHLSLLLNMTTAPMVVGRRLFLKEILAIASKALFNTVVLKGRKTCFYSECRYCSLKNLACDNGYYLDGAIVLWLPQHLHLNHFRHPWRRSYRNLLTGWEKNKNYCDQVTERLASLHQDDKVLLNLIDMSVFDFLIQNGDRHMYSLPAQDPGASVALLDNGKSFMDPYVDFLDILAPLLQCCRIKRSTYDSLQVLTGGGLSKAMEDLLYLDPLQPILSVSNLRALDRRLTFVLAAIELCVQQKGEAAVFM